MRYHAAALTVAVASVLAACGSATTQSGTPPPPSASPTPTTVSCHVNLQFGGSIPGTDTSTAHAQLTGSGQNAAYSMDSSLVAADGNHAYTLAWRHASVSLTLETGEGSVSNPSGLTMSADGRQTSFSDISITSQTATAGVETISGQVSC